MIKNIFIGWFNKLFKKNNELYERRIAICNQCDSKLQLTPKESICKECGCVLSAKCRVKDEKCVLNKWQYE